MVAFEHYNKNIIYFISIFWKYSGISYLSMLMLFYCKNYMKYIPPKKKFTYNFHKLFACEANRILVFRTILVTMLYTKACATQILFFSDYCIFLQELCFHILQFFFADI